MIKQFFMTVIFAHSALFAVGCAFEDACKRYCVAVEALCNTGNTPVDWVDFFYTWQDLDATCSHGAVKADKKTYPINTLSDWTWYHKDWLMEQYKTLACGTKRVLVLGSWSITCTIAARTELDRDNIIFDYSEAHGDLFMGMPHERLEIVDVVTQGRIINEQGLILACLVERRMIVQFDSSGTIEIVHFLPSGNPSITPIR